MALRSSASAAARWRWRARSGRRLGHSGTVQDSDERTASAFYAVDEVVPLRRALVCQRCRCVKVSGK